MIRHSLALAFFVSASSAAFAQDTPLRAPEAILCDIEGAFNRMDMPLKGLRAELDGDGEFILKEDGNTLPAEGLSPYSMGQIIGGLKQDLGTDSTDTFRQGASAIESLTHELDEALSNSVMPQEGQTHSCKTPDLLSYGIFKYFTPQA